MVTGAPRRAWCGLCGLARGAWLTLALLAPATGARACELPPWIGAAMPGSLTELHTSDTPSPGPVAAWFEEPTTRYAHGVLGDAIEAGALVAQLDDFPNCITGRIDLPQDAVFEDLAPRLHDLNFDGHPEIIVVESAANAGARLSIYGLTPDRQGLQLYAATTHIGTRNRWLAPIGVADFNGDGQMDIAYVDRPHLARTLRIWSFVPGGLAGTGELREIANAGGFTNHRIGEDFITGGVRDCGTGPEMVLADAGWSQVMVARMAGAEIVAEPVAPFSASAVADALACR